MKVLQFEQSSRPAATQSAAPAKPGEPPDDPARKHAAPEESPGHDEPGYGHGV